MNIIPKVLFSFVLSFFISFLAIPQNADDKYNEAYNLIGLRTYSGNIIAHAADVENTAGSRPYVFEFEYSKRHIGASVWDLCRCYPTTGFLLAYKNYDNRVLGHGFHLAYFVQYHFLQTTRISPFIRGVGGFEYNTNPYHEIKNPCNQSYSMPLNFSLQYSAGLNFRINERIFTDFSLAFNHISNGGLRQPNRGINWPSFGLAVYYSPDFVQAKNRKSQSPQYDESEKWAQRLDFYFSAHSKTFAQKERFGIFGAEYSIARRLSNLHAINTAVEWNLDMSRYRRIEYNNLQKDPHRLGILAGHEFIMGRFRFSQKLGIYLFDELKLTNPLYHKWGIHYLHNSGFITGIEVKAHRNVAEFVCVRVGWGW